MTVFQLLLKLVADLRSQNGEAKATLLQLIALILGFNPIPAPTPTPTPEIGTMSGMSDADANTAADQIEAFCSEHNKPGAAKFGDGVLLGKLIELVLKLLPLFGLKKPA